MNLKQNIKFRIFKNFPWKKNSLTIFEWLQLEDAIKSDLAVKFSMYSFQNSLLWMWAPYFETIYKETTSDLMWKFVFCNLFINFLNLFQMRSYFLLNLDSKFIIINFVILLQKLFWILVKFFETSRYACKKKEWQMSLLYMHLFLALIT